MFILNEMKCLILIIIYKKYIQIKTKSHSVRDEMVMKNFSKDREDIN
jgi:hypothetical protein